MAPKVLYSLADMPRWALPDGRVLIVERAKTPIDSPSWECWIDGEPDAAIVGSPLNSTIAELLGYEVAHQTWPRWIDELASEITEKRGDKSPAP